MDRQELIGRAILHEPHEQYGLLTAGKYEALHLLKCKMLTPGEMEPEDIGVAWMVCTLGNRHELIQKAIKEGSDTLREYWEDALHVSEMETFTDWFNQSWLEVEAASTKAKKKAGKGGK